MPLRAVAKVAGVAFLDDQIDQRLATEVVRQGPGLSLRQPHQRGLDDEAPIHAEIQRRLERVQGVAAAVGVAGEVRLAHAAHQMGQPAPVRQGRGIGQEHQVTPRHEGRGKAPLGHLYGPLGGEGGRSDGAEAPDIDDMVFAEPAHPHRKATRDPLAHPHPSSEFGCMALAVVEADRLDPLIAVQRPGEADAGILAAGEQHQGGGGWRR